MFFDAPILILPILIGIFEIVALVLAVIFLFYAIKLLKVFIRQKESDMAKESSAASVVQSQYTQPMA
ncbi:hypothetical protein [Arcanobacterium canis]